MRKPAERRMTVDEVIRLCGAEAGPYVAFTVLEQRGDPILSQAAEVVWIVPVADESLTISVELEDAVGQRAEPHRAISIFECADHTSDSLTHGPSPPHPETH